MNPRPQIILYIIIIIVIISLMALAARWLPRQGRAQHVPKIWGSWYASFLRYARGQIHRYADCSTNAALRRRWHSWQHGSRHPWSIAKGRPVASTRTHTYLLTYLRFTHTHCPAAQSTLLVFTGREYRAAGKNTPHRTVRGWCGLIAVNMGSDVKSWSWSCVLRSWSCLGLEPCGLVNITDLCR